MRTLFLSLACAFASFAQSPGPRVIFAPGAWSLCPVSPQFCVAPGSEQWSIWVRGGDAEEVLAYRLTVSYTGPDGNAGQAVLLLNRAENATGYSGEWFTLGKIHIRSVWLTPLKAASPPERSDF